jgi:hypothetical protein
MLCDGPEIDASNKQVAYTPSFAPQWKEALVVRSRNSKHDAVEAFRRNLLNKNVSKKRDRARTSM